uniref:Thioredoxin reductase n=1 Tax=Penicillium lilacinoechinulatum TaxID=451136 RepID=A9Q1F6_9EURO|nr:thioredoxin reductase [Penicillium lilacinoechinulatum]
MAWWLKMGDAPRLGDLLAHEVSGPHLRHRISPHHNLNERIFDALIVGGGSAGLSASLALARVQRTALLAFNSDHYRKLGVTAIHTVSLRDGKPPSELFDLLDLIQMDARFYSMWLGSVDPVYTFMIQSCWYHNPEPDAVLRSKVPSLNHQYLGIDLNTALSHNF